ncbi:OmpA family protein [Aeromonas dhakensis]
MYTPRPLLHPQYIALFFILPFSFSSMAGEGYFGAKTGWVHGHHACDSQRLTCDNDALGAGVFAGYDINNWLAVEAGYDYFGNMKADYPALGHQDVTAPYSGSVQGIELGAKPYYALNDHVQLFTKVGTLAWWTDVTGDEVGYQYHARDNGWSPMLGAGVEMAMTDNLSARLEYQWFHNVGGESTGGSSINLLSMGVAYRFGAKPVAPAVPAVAMTVQALQSNGMLHIQLDEFTDGMLFTFDSAALTPAIITALQPVLDKMHKSPWTRLTIEAHTDSLGPTVYNQKLSQRRAAAVADYFEHQGIAASRLTLDARGETQPIADNHTPAGRAKNRRVALHLSSLTAEQGAAPVTKGAL